MQTRAQGIYPLNYYPHNLHFQCWSAMLIGRPADALQAARKIAGKIPSDYANNKNVWAQFETFRSQPMFVMVRFGMWDQMLAEPKPEATAKFMQGIWHYGRAMAYLNKNRMNDAQTELSRLTRMRGELSAAPYYIGFGTADQLLTIAEEIVMGELRYAEGETLQALGHLERAIRLEDGLLYSEPPDWYFPVRHMLGAMLLDAGRPKEAEVVYAADLKKNPENGYSLHGLKVALERQGRMEEAREVSDRFDRAWNGATHLLTSSRY
jgi:tetratricopeptide (TPR) repeat protein